MPKKKVAVALSDWLLVDLDDFARARGMSRSAVVEEATREYVTRQRSAHGEAEYRAEATAALEDMKAFAVEYAADPTTRDEPESLEQLRALRASGRGLGE
jgi:metal-responsive CopG/Arc/MetJ family transcriptional regulator